MLLRYALTLPSASVGCHGDEHSAEAGTRKSSRNEAAAGASQPGGRMIAWGSPDGF